MLADQAVQRIEDFAAVAPRITAVCQDMLLSLQASALTAQPYHMRQLLQITLSGWRCLLQQILLLHSVLTSQASDQCISAH